MLMFPQISVASREHVPSALANLPVDTSSVESIPVPHERSNLSARPQTRPDRTIFEVITQSSGNGLIVSWL